MTNASLHGKISLSCLALIEYLAAQPATATPAEQATRILRANRGQGETRSLMQIYTFTKDELAKILQRACQLFAQQDGVYDFLPGHFGRNIAVIDVLAEIDLAINTSRADPEHWLDEMIAANMALSIYVPDEEELDEILRTGEIPYVGQPITYKSDDDDYGLAPVA